MTTEINRVFFEIDLMMNSVAGNRSFLRNYYGSDSGLVVQRAEKISHILASFHESFPSEKKIAVFRVPGRINLMGVHIDHRGGWCNYIPIARETIFCVSPREDDAVIARNVTPKYPASEYSISGELPRSCRGSWLDWIETVQLERGHWSNYLKAGILKLQDSLPDTPLKGMNVMVDGDIPPRSGLSSSSTLVVGAVLALCHVNQISLPEYDKIELCGEGEWYVGTRGGCGDHAALILGRLQKITHMGFKPLSASIHPIPQDVSVIIAESGIQANKATGARETFNSRIAAYEAAFVICKDSHPQFQDRLEFIRDISPENLEIALPDFYRALKTVPVSASKEELLVRYPHLKTEWDRIFTTFGEPAEPLPLREVLLFGVSECARAKEFPKLLKSGDVARAGKYMYTSHDGDRVTVWDKDKQTPYRSPYDDAYLDELAAGLEQNPDCEALYTAWQPGGYRCSVPELDRLVDRCKTLDGVYGAGLTGAGLGGSVLVLAQTDKAPQITGELKTLISQWYEGEPFVEVCSPVAGAGMIEV